MIAHGDELGRTQLGNNNGYCQDNPITWVDWENADQDLLEFTRLLIRVAPSTRSSAAASSSTASRSRSGRTSPTSAGCAPTRSP